MVFIRVKEFCKNGSKYRYAYLVLNVWKKRKAASRQKVGKYLGRVLNFEATLGIELLPCEKTKIGIIKSLAAYELRRRGFSEKGTCLEKEGVNFDIERLRFIDKNGKEAKIVLEMNEGFLCNHTLKALLGYVKKNEDSHEDAIELAKAFLEAGLKVGNEMFIQYFELS